MFFGDVSLTLTEFQIYSDLCVLADLIGPCLNTSQLRGQS